MSDTAAWQSGANSIKPSSVEGNICAFAEGLNDGLGIVRSKQTLPEVVAFRQRAYALDDVPSFCTMLGGSKTINNRVARSTPESIGIPKSERTNTDNGWSSVAPDNEERARNDGPNDSPEQHLVLKAGRGFELTEDQQKNEHVIHAE